MTDKKSTLTPLVIQAALAILVLAACIAATPIAQADDYRLMPLPVLGAARKDDLVMPLPKPEDLAVCQPYLQNLRYFARRNVPMSCERPIAPEMRSRIQRVEWEDLDPDRHFKLFNALTKELFGKIPVYIPEDLPEELKIRKMHSWVYETPAEPTGPNEYALNELRKKLLVFRRAKLELQGYPKHYGVVGEPPRPGPEKIHIVQFGHNVTDSDYPGVLRCEPARGNTPGQEYSDTIRFYVVSANLNDLFGPLYILGKGHSGEHLLLIDGHPYVETMHSTAYINLSRINLSAPVFLEPVCLYEFVKPKPRRK